MINLIRLAVWQSVWLALPLLAMGQPETKFRMPSTPDVEHPQLYGQHFRITTVAQPGYVDMLEDETTGKIQYSGYLIEVLRAIAREDRANFTFDLLPPSGFGSACIGRLDFNDDNITLDSPQAYSKPFRSQYKCGESDTNDRPLSAYSTDMYWSLYYITPPRLAVSKFTIPISPPTIGNLGMMGTATGIRSIEDLAQNFSHLPVCAFAGTAYLDNLKISFPELNLRPIMYEQVETERALSDGTCDILIGPVPELQDAVANLARQGKCFFNEKPIGIIGQPLSYGFNHFGFGVRSDIPDEVLMTINFWMNALMTCFPDDPNSLCSEQMGGGSFSVLHKGLGGTGDECGYVLFPLPESNRLSPGVISAIVITPVVLVLGLAAFYHLHQLKKQEQRMKKRFIQQLARNIEIGESARDIPAEKLTEAFKHIGGEDGLISKQDLARWINDLHMDFMSEKDFERLWNSLDMEGTGLVDPIDFITFLKNCAPQFKEVHDEYSALPKTERIKLASRRLSNISALGEEGVLALERRNNRRSRRIPHLGTDLVDTNRFSGASTMSGQSKRDIST